MRELAIHAISRGVAATDLREVVLGVAWVAGFPRSTTGLQLLAEAARDAVAPSDPFAALLEPRARPRDEPDPGASDVVPSSSGGPPGSGVFARVHGERAQRVRMRLEGRSVALARALESGLYDATLGRPGLALPARILATVGALYPLDARADLEDFVHAARAHGFAVDQLWELADLLARLFKEGPEVRAAVAGFETVLGRRFDSSH